MNYEVRIEAIEAENGDKWYAYYPDLKGCGGSGKTKEEALSMGEKEKEFLIESLIAIGEPLPSVMKTSNYSGKFTMRISKTLHEKATICADRQGVSLNALVAEAIAEKIAGADMCKKMEDVCSNRIIENTYRSVEAVYKFNKLQSTGVYPWKN